MSSGPLAVLGCVALVGTAALWATEPFAVAGPNAVVDGAEWVDRPGAEPCAERERQLHLDLTPGRYRVGFDVRGPPGSQGRVALIFHDRDRQWIPQDGAALFDGAPNPDWSPHRTRARGGSRARSAQISVASRGCGPDLEVRGGVVLPLQERPPWTAGWWAVACTWLVAGAGAARMALAATTERAAAAAALGATAVAVAGMCLPAWAGWALFGPVMQVQRAATAAAAAASTSTAAVLPVPDLQVLSHGALFAALALFWLRAWSPRTTLLALGLLAPVSELLQGGLIHDRGAQLADLAADWTGLVLVLGLAWAWRGRLRR